MPLATSYDETTLAAWLVLRLGLVATLLGWRVGHPQVGEAVADVERLLGVSDIAEHGDARKIERLGAVCIWQRAIDNFVALYDQTIDAETFKRSQLLAQAQQSLAAALSVVQAAGDTELSTRTVKIVRRRYPGDPFTVIPEEQRAMGWQP